MPVNTSTIVGAGALSKKKLKYVPESIEIIHMMTENQSIVAKLRATRKAIAPGAISRPTAKIRPVAANVVIIVIERMVNRP